MAHSTHPNYSERVRDYIESRLGAPIVDARRRIDCMGWEVRGANGSRMMISDQDMYELTGDISRTRNDVRFPDRRMDYPMYAMDSGMNSYQYFRTPDDLYQGTRMGPNMGYEEPKPKPKPKNNFRKVFWHRYSKTGQIPTTN